MNRIKFLQQEVPEDIFFFETGLKWATAYLEYEFNQYMQMAGYNYLQFAGQLTIEDFKEAQNVVDKYRKILDTELYKVIHDK